MEIDRYDRFIVIRAGRYLASAGDGIGKLRMTDSPWDAWQETDKGKAQMVAKRIGGRIRRFNLVTGTVDWS